MTDIPFEVPELIDFDVTCHTENCENKDIVIRIGLLELAPRAICGPCGIKIEDVIPVG